MNINRRNNEDKNKDVIVLINKPKKRLEPIRLSNTIVASSSHESLNSCESQIYERASDRQDGPFRSSILHQDILPTPVMSVNI